MRFLLAIALSSTPLISACVGRGAQVPQVLQLPQSPPVVSDPRRFPEVDHEIGKRIALMVGLPVLRESPMSLGDREIRVSYHPSGMVWDASSMLRLVERNGRVEGELYLYWVMLADDSVGRFHTPPWRRTCTTLSAIKSLVEGYAYCPVPSWHASWRAIADSLEVLGAWDLLGHGNIMQPRRQVHVTDQDDVFVEGVVAGRYGSIDYYAPAIVGDAASKVLIALGDMVVQLTRQRLYR